MLSKKGLFCAIYSDSQTRIAWVRNKTVRSASMAKAQTRDQVNDLVKRALTWLNTNEYTNELLKWETRRGARTPLISGASSPTLKAIDPTGTVYLHRPS
jgi:ribonuclease HI